MYRLRESQAYRSSKACTDGPSNCGRLKGELALRHVLWFVVIALAFGSLSTAHADGKLPTVDPDGTVHVPASDLPFSSLASPEAKEAFIQQVRSSGDLRGARTPQWWLEKIKAWNSTPEDSDGLAKLLLTYPVDIQAKTIDGVYTEIFTPKEGIAPRNDKRVLIALHGQGFIGGSASASWFPIASVGKIKVVSIGYRVGPENKFPAASEDVATVYRALLKTYQARNIGIYGLSAGAMLTSESMAWFDKGGLPLPGAIGMFCGATGPFSVGDTHYTIAHITGAPPVSDEDGGMGPMVFYFGQADPKSPLVYAANSRTLLAKFPPSLLLTSTRAEDMSGVVHSHIQLVMAGVHAELYVWDGLGHCGFGNPNIPESREAIDIVVKFFDRQLGRGSAPRNPGTSGTNP
jgi:monoterpene epsilon-lactone hydrolase